MKRLGLGKRARLLVAATVVGALPLTGLVSSLTPSHAASLPVPMHSVGVFRGSGNPAGVHDFETRALGGQKVPFVLEHGAYNTWDDIESPGWFLNIWKGTGYKLVISVDPLPSGATLQAAANGSYNSYWKIQLQKFVDAGFPDAILRVGHEFNCCYTWGAAQDPNAYIGMFRQYVSVARSIPGQHFLFDWNPLIGGGNMPAEKAYPGDDVVDIIGLDVYDDAIFGADPATRWTNMMNSSYGLVWQRDFAAAHGKMMSFPEWGVDNRPMYPNRSGGDNPYFIQKMHDWINSNNVLYASSYNDDNSDYHSDMLDGAFPNSLSMFRSIFTGTQSTSGTSGTTATTTAPAAGATTTTTAPAAPASSQTAPPAPANLTASATSSSVTLNWTPAPGADGNNIFRNGQQIAWPLDPTLKSYTDSGLAAGTYNYYIRAYNGQGNGDATATVTVATQTVAPTTSTTMPAPTTTTTAQPAPTTTTTAKPAPTTTTTTKPAPTTTTTAKPVLQAPAAPSSLTATAKVGAVTLNWTPSPTADGNNVYRNGVQIAWPLNSKLSTYSDSGLAPGNYSYSLRAYNSAGPGAATATVTVSVPNPVGPPAPPTNLTVSATGNAVSLNWVSSPTADGYNIFRNGTHIAWPLGSGLSHFADSGLAKGTYTYYVRAYNGYGNGSASTTVTVTVR